MLYIHSECKGKSQDADLQVWEQLSVYIKTKSCAQTLNINSTLVYYEPSHVSDKTNFCLIFCNFTTFYPHNYGKNVDIHV